MDAVFGSIGLLKAVVLVIGYALIGGAIKYIDQAFDENVYNKRIAVFLAVLAGLLMAYFMSTDLPSAVIFLSIILGVAISRKIDNLGFYIGVSVVFVASTVYRYFTNTLFLDLVPVAALTISAFIDEVGNDLADQGKLHGFVKNFFDDRFFMKVIVLIFVIIEVFHWVYLAAFLGFDVAYSLVAKHSEKFIAHRREFIDCHLELGKMRNSSA